MLGAAGRQAGRQAGHPPAGALNRRLLPLLLRPLGVSRPLAAAHSSQIGRVWDGTLQQPAQWVGGC
jgi:hypothetical protein